MMSTSESCESGPGVNSLLKVTFFGNALKEPFVGFWVLQPVLFPPLSGRHYCIDVNFFSSQFEQLERSQFSATAGRTERRLGRETRHNTQLFLESVQSGASSSPCSSNT